MTIRFSTRIAASCCALCATGVLALTPAPASARPTTDTTADATKPSAADAHLLYRSGTHARLRPRTQRLVKDLLHR